MTDSTSYLNQDILNRLNITIIPLSVHFPDESFKETEVKQDYFYQKIERTGVIPTSSQPSQGEIYGAFRDILANGEDILAIFISSAMSGTFSTAISVKEQLSREFPFRRIEILDSRTNCMALGVQVIAAAEMIKAGGSIESAVEAACYARDSVHFYFAPKTLDYLRKGGRIGTASALLGSLLHITPILTVDMEKGMTHLVEKVRGASRAVSRILELMNDDYNRLGLKAIVIHHINAPEEARQLKRRLGDAYDLPVSICSIGPVIGLHTGLGTVGVVYLTGRQ